MTRVEAIQAMRYGERITHTYFSPDEYLFMEEEEVSSEDGVHWGYINDPRNFKCTCLDPTDPTFDDGWSIYKPQ